MQHAVFLSVCLCICLSVCVCLACVRLSVSVVQSYRQSVQAVLSQGPCCQLLVCLATIKLAFSRCFLQTFAKRNVTVFRCQRPEAWPHPNISRASSRLPAVQAPAQLESHRPSSRLRGTASDLFGHASRLRAHSRLSRQQTKQGNFTKQELKFTFPVRGFQPVRLF